MDNRRGGLPPAVGGVSLLTAFAVLCLTVFALLSLATVRADGRLADSAVQGVADYYAADCRAQEVLARLRAGERPEEAARDGDVYSYACPISDTRELSVEVLVRGDGSYQVLRWQAVPTALWEADDSLELWDGTPF